MCRSGVPGKFAGMLSFAAKKSGAARAQRIHRSVIPEVAPLSRQTFQRPRTSMQLRQFTPRIPRQLEICIGVFPRG